MDILTTFLLPPSELAIIEIYPNSGTGGLVAWTYDFYDDWGYEYKIPAYEPYIYDDIKYAWHLDPKEKNPYFEKWVDPILKQLILDNWEKGKKRHGHKFLVPAYMIKKGNQIKFK